MREAKTNLSRLVEAVETGAEQEIVSARNGKPIARIVPLAAKAPVQRIGIAEGRFAPFDVDPEVDAEIERMFNPSG